MKAFSALGIPESILQVIEEKKFTEPSEIQTKSIPLVLEGKDVIGGSATGSGKTLAFGIGIIEKAVPGDGIQALVMTPTRELAQQVAMEIKGFSKYKKLKVATIYGGIGIHPQIANLTRADVVVGTPGRLLDHLGRGTMNLKNVKVLVLDEADRMFDMGFIDDVEQIISACPKKRQTMLFSATITEDVSRVSRRYMHEPVKVSAKSHVDEKKLTQVYYSVPDNKKLSLLVHLLKKESPGLVMIFSNTQRNVDFVTKNLNANGLNALALHGGYSQQKRDQALDRFHKGNLGVLVCTDVAARGLDIKNVSHVYNYDIPNDSKQYVHRIGRTARAGSEGKAVNILGARDHENFQRVLNERPGLIKQLKIPEVGRIKVRTEASPDRNRTGGRSGSYGERSSRSPPSRSRAQTGGNSWKSSTMESRERFASR